MPEFNYDNTIRGIQYEGGDNKVGYVVAYVASAVTAASPYKLTPDATYGWLQAALPSGAEDFHLGIAMESYATGAYGRFAVDGIVSITVGTASITATHALECDAGTFETIGAAFDESNHAHMAKCLVKAAAATSVTARIIGGRFVTSST